MIELRIDGLTHARRNDRATPGAEDHTDRHVAALESLESLLFEMGAVSVELCDAADQPLLEPPPGTHPLWDHITLKAHFSDPICADLATIALPQHSVEPNLITLRTIEARDWVREGLAGLGAMDFGGDLWVVPSWATDAVPSDATVVHLDPGLAFGTGTHPTTALCLQALAASPPRNARVLDYGCGSGILAIAAARLGAHAVDAFDIDPQAILATRENAQRNDLPTLPFDANAIDPRGLSVAVVSAEAPAKLMDATYDTVVANILARPLIGLAQTLTAALKPGGRILLTGLLDEQANDVIAAYPDIEWRPSADWRRLDGWVLLEGHRRRPAAS